MKKVFFIIFILLGNTFFIKAQKYTRFPKDSATWLVDWGGIVFTCSSQAANYARYNYVFDGDTIINSLPHKKVYKNGYIYSGNCYFGSPLGYQGAFREDTLQKKAFIILPGDTIDSLIYDFNLNLGDTIKGFLAPQNFCGARVVSLIDSILVDNKYRKQFHVQIYNCGFAHYVEGIGSLDGLLEPYIDFEWQGTLTCYWIDTSLIYTWNSSCVPLAVENNNLKELTVKVFPNPSNDRIEFHLNGKNKTLCVISLFNKFGKQVFNTEFSNSISINIQDEAYSSGIYFYRIRNLSSGKFISGKVIIEDN